ncbi:hypothetical protein [Peribacillus sp. NPDC097895]|uniref:hypothetical protein n=1 Tax=Peribacillus sp. NPDC097895 TaxID=3390619 RepID=UPI003CFCCE3B
MKKVMSGILIMGMMAAASYFLVIKQEGFNIKVKNHTDEDISGLHLSYDHINSDINIPSIQPGKEYKLNVTPTEDFTESSMILHYKDREGKLHTESIIGYFEKGYVGKAIITLESMDKNGEIQMTVKDDTKIY